jgi:hypothetical protein
MGDVREALCVITSLLLMHGLAQLTLEGSRVQCQAYQADRVLRVHGLRLEQMPRFLHEFCSFSLQLTCINTN